MLRLAMMASCNFTSAIFKNVKQSNLINNRRNFVRFHLLDDVSELLDDDGHLVGVEVGVSEHGDEVDDATARPVLVAKRAHDALTEVAAWKFQPLVEMKKTNKNILSQK